MAADASRDDQETRRQGIANATTAAVDGATAAELPSHAGARIGRYVVLDLVGAGGMGRVYSAYDPELDRRIALKVLRFGAEAPGRAARMRYRLLREAQALARISHPNVVVVHDVSTAGEELFVAMEYLAGDTLRDWVRDTRPPADVIAVYAQAGRGLAAAHAAGVVHRDFKPENVIVGGDGRARVLDFGLARAADAADSADSGISSSPLASPITVAGAVMGTPRYMAPEQVRGHSDARSDQFSFCVALYEALQGEPPFGGATLEERAAAAREGRLRPWPTGVPPRARRAVARGLSFLPADRYPSMDALLGDLQPRAARTRRRAIAAGLALLAVGAAAVAAQRTEPLCRAADRLAGVWDEARGAQVRGAFLRTGLPYGAETAVRVTGRLDAYARDWTRAMTDACEATHVRRVQSPAVLDLVTACLEQRRGELRALAELLAGADKRVVDRAVAASRALSSLEPCGDTAALLAVVPPPSPSVRARAEIVGRRLATAKALANTGDYEAALLVGAPLPAEAALMGYPPLAAQAHLFLGTIRQARGDFRAGEAHLEDALAAAVAGRDDRTAATAVVRLVLVVGNRLARHDDGHRLARQAEAWTARLGGDAELEGDRLQYEGMMLEVEGKLDDSLRHHDRSLAVRERAFPPDHPDLAASYTNRGSALLALGRYPEARADLERALAIRERAFGPDHPEVAGALANVGTVASSQGDNDGAIAAYRRALPLLEARLGENQTVATVLSNLGVVYVSVEQYEQAEAVHRRALAMREKIFGPDNPETATSHSNLGDALNGLRRHDEALRHFERAAEVWRRSLGPDNPRLAFALTGLGEAQLGRGAPAAAIPALERARAVRLAAGADPQLIAETDSILARALWAAGERRRAEEAASRARAAWEGQPPSDAGARRQLARLAEWERTRR